MSTIADLTGAVASLTSAVAAVVAQGATGGLSPADQAALDAAVTDITTQTADLTALETPPPASAPASVQPSGAS